MIQTPLMAWIEGIGFIAPGLNDWPATCAVLRGEAAYVAAPSLLPAPSILPVAERRRARRFIADASGLAAGRGRYRCGAIQQLRL